MKKLVIFTFSLILLMSVLSGCSTSEKTIVVGAKDYTEQDILGNILTILVSENTDIKVTYKNEMSSNVLFEALKSGDVDLSVDYTGTVYANYLQYSDMKTADEVFEISKNEIKDKFNLLMLDSLGYNNTYTLSIRKDTAEKYQLKTYSDLAKVSEELVLGGSFEVLNRNDGIPNLKLIYNMKFKEEKALEGTLRYIALQNDEIQITDAFSTDGLLLEYDLFVLEDDKNFFPPYHAVPVIREKTAEKYPELIPLIEKLVGILTDNSMRELNYKVDVLKENPRDVAKTFLKEVGLIS